MFKAQKIELSFFRKEKHSEEIFSFYFTTTEKFHYQPGQYLYIILPHENVDDKGSTRYFTIASSPSEDHIMITTRRTKSSFKKTLFALTPGTTLLCFGPMGKFVLLK